MRAFDILPHHVILQVMMVFLGHSPGMVCILTLFMYSSFGNSNSNTVVEYKTQLHLP